MKGWAILLVLLSGLFIFFLVRNSPQQGEIDKLEKFNIIVTSEEDQGQNSPSRTTGASEKGSSANEKVLFIIAQNNFRDEELTKPKKILENAGYDVDVASITTDQTRGMMGLIVKPDLAVIDVNVSLYALVVVVGGSGAPSLANYPEVLSLLKKAITENKKIAGICLGPVVLAKAGVLQGKNATVFKSTSPDSVAILQSGGANFVDKSLVTDGWLVTANGPAVSQEFGDALVKLLQS